MKLLQELNSLRPFSFTRKNSPGRVIYSFPTKDDVIDVYFMFRHTGMEVFIGFARKSVTPTPGSDLDTRKEEGTDVAEVFAKLPKIVHQFLKDHPQVRILTFQTAGRRIQIYERLIKKFADSMGFKLSYAEDGVFELERKR